MEGNNQNNNNDQNNGSFTYGNYSDYYYSQYYSTPQPPIPQGDPSNALTSMVYQLQQQSQQRQALGAMAAASISSVLGGRQQQVDYNASYYGANQDQRSVINYDDLSLAGTSASAIEPSTKETPDPFSATK